MSTTEFCNAVNVSEQTYQDVIYMSISGFSTKEIMHKTSLTNAKVNKLIAWYIQLKQVKVDEDFKCTACNSDTVLGYCTNGCDDPMKELEF